MKKVIILGYLIGLIGFQSFTRENAAVIFIESEGENAQGPLFRPLEALLPNTLQNISAKGHRLRKTNLSSDTLGIIQGAGEINLITRLDGFEGETRDPVPRFIRFASEKDWEK